MVYKTIFSNYTSSNCAGVANLKIVRQFSDNDGRFIIADIQTAVLCLTLVDIYIYIYIYIYASNNDNRNFFKNVADRIKNFRCEDIIIGGDFHLTLRPGSNVELHMCRI